LRPAFKHSLRQTQGADMTFFDMSDPTLNRQFAAFWRNRDPFFRPEREALPPMRRAAAPPDERADDYTRFIERARAALRAEDKQ
jgi:hypothetical protein